MVTRARDNSTWPFGTDAEVARITASTSGIMGPAITAAIPPVFQVYATVVLPLWGEGQADHDRAMLAPLR